MHAQDGRSDVGGLVGRADGDERVGQGKSERKQVVAFSSSRRGCDHVVNKWVVRRGSGGSAGTQEFTRASAAWRRDVVPQLCTRDQDGRTWLVALGPAPAVVLAETWPLGRSEHSPVAAFPRYACTKYGFANDTLRVYHVGRKKRSTYFLRRETPSLRPRGTPAVAASRSNLDP